MKEKTKEALLTIAKEVAVELVVLVGKRLVDMGTLLKNEHLNSLRGSSDTGLWPGKMFGPPVEGGNSEQAVSRAEDAHTTSSPRLKGKLETN